ncbi:hypothetical protein [Ktedonobacter racemifer]|uniref:Uncharacterized protein n=1 Tax=Ktedonobacter racemifer DSM 44963 TaxID=485913 RepID=D6U8P5_KTERA|nr:hypothetical protein [Ktedonobacter racemifer]EFH79605.1 hypothetical protein Krac_0083 [Ktedonobacter racemifer DSM 44963]
MNEMHKLAAQAARASRGGDWYIDERLSEGEITLPENLPIRMWIFTLKHRLAGHMGYEIVVWNRSRFISIEMQ